MPVIESPAANPLRVGLARERAADPCNVVIFGAAGDLTKRKLVPALYNVALDRLLSAGLGIVGMARKPLSDAEFQAHLKQGVSEHSRRPLENDVWDVMAARMSYITSDFSDIEGYKKLAALLDESDQTRGTGGNRVFYLAVPPSAFPTIVTNLAAVGLNKPGKNGNWARVVVEKPFGHDLASARELNASLHSAFDENAIFRIDHYLGKETVQNLMVFRFANSIFEPLWNHKYVDHVQITVGESIGVEGRGGYFEEAGMTRDMLQNHMFQLMCLVGMEPPVSLDANATRDEKVKVLRALRPIPIDKVPQETVRGQYGPGVLGGKPVAGYLEEDGVAKNSRTETYVAARVFVDNWRWAGVPFYLRAGKRLTKRVTEIALVFRDVPHRLFPGPTDARFAPNVLALRIQPDEGITLKFDSKVPGAVPRRQPVTMEFRYGASFGAEPPDAYERLLFDAILGDSTLFIRRDEVEAAWAWIDNLEAAWRLEGADEPIPVYAAGTWGPSESDVLLSRDGRAWRRL